MAGGIQIFCHSAVGEQNLLHARSSLGQGRGIVFCRRFLFGFGIFVTHKESQVGRQDWLLQAL